MQLVRPNAASLDTPVVWTPGWPRISRHLMPWLRTEFGCSSALPFDAPRYEATFHISYSLMAHWIRGLNKNTQENSLRSKFTGSCLSTKFCEMQKQCYSQRAKRKQSRTGLLALPLQSEGGGIRH